jgi:transcription initiation factor IIE alpha subunit
MKEIVKKLLHDPNYRKITHVIFSEKLIKPEEIKEHVDIPEDSIQQVLNDLQNSGIIEIKDEGIRRKLEDFMLIIDFRTGSIYAVISEKKASEIRGIIESTLNPDSKAPETNE